MSYTLCCPVWNELFWVTVHIEAIDKDYNNFEILLMTQYYLGDIKMWNILSYSTNSTNFIGKIF